MHLRSVLEVSTSFFSCGDTFPFRFSFFQYDLCLILLTIFLCFPFVVPCHFCSSPHTWGCPSSLLTRWISLAGVEEPCVFSLFGRRLSRKLTREVSLEDGMPRTFTRYGAQKLAWHWKSSVSADTEHLAWSWILISLSQMCLGTASTLTCQS